MGIISHSGQFGDLSVGIGCYGQQICRVQSSAVINKQLEREVAWSAFASSPVALVQVFHWMKPGLTPVSPGLIMSVFVPSMHRSLSNVDFCHCLVSGNVASYDLYNL